MWEIDYCETFVIYRAYKDGAEVLADGIAFAYDADDKAVDSQVALEAQWEKKRGFVFDEVKWERVKSDEYVSFIDSLL